MIASARTHPMRGILALAISCALAACQSQTPHGVGPVTLQTNVQLAYLRHLDRPHPVVFLIGADGSTAYGTYCPHALCEPDPLYIRAERSCAERAGKPCYVFAIRLGNLN